MEDAIYRTVKALIDAGVNPKKKNDDGEIAYMVAGKACMYPFLKAVAEAGVKMDAVGDEGKNLLHMITDVLYHRKTVNGFRDNAYKTIQILLESGSPDPEDKDIFNRTPLDYAQKSDVKEIAALISGDEGAAATGGMTLNQAVLNNDLEAVVALLEQGADPGELSEDKHTPLMWACEYPRPEIIKLLLKHKANPNFTVGETGVTALSYLLTHSVQNLGRGFKGGSQPPKDIRSILRMLLDAGADPNAPLDQNGNTPLIYVANMDYFAGLNSSLAEELIDGGADINKANLSGQTPLMIFAIKGDESEHNIAELLLDNGADPAMTDGGSNTALMYAASNSNKMSGKKIAELILSSGYKEIDRVNNAGQTAMDIAVTRENEALVKLLVTAM
jgi:ankyrin repeat protein